MKKVRFKVAINWQGQVFEYYRHANSAEQALRHAIRELAREVGYNTRYVRDYVMNANRYEVGLR